MTFAAQRRRVDVAKHARGEEDRYVTIADVVDEHLGEWTTETADALTLREVDDFAEAVNGWYSSPPPQVDDFCVYAGGWVARNLAGHGQRQLSASLLYAPSVVIHDPFAEFFDRGRSLLEGLPPIPSASTRLDGRREMYVAGDELTLWKSGGYFGSDNRLAAFRRFCRETLPSFSLMAPLIRAGVVIPISELAVLRPELGRIRSAVRNDSRDDDLRKLILDLAASGNDPARSNSIRGAEVTPTGGVARGYESRAVVQNPAFYLQKTMAITAAIGSRYLPQATGDAALLEFQLRRLGNEIASKSNKNVEIRLLPALATSELPFLRDLDPRLILQIRADQEVFEAWRTQLRNIARVIELLPSAGTSFEQEASDVLADGLNPLAAEVRRVVSTSPTLRDVTRDTVADLSINLSSLGYASMAMGHEGMAVTAVVALIAAPFQWAYRALFRSGPGESRAVIAQLVDRG